MRKRFLVVLVAVFLCGCGGNQLPENATAVGTACADVTVIDYGYRFGFGWITTTTVQYDPITKSTRPVTQQTYGYGYSWGETGSHIENKCETIYVTPTPLHPER